MPNTKIVEYKDSKIDWIGKIPSNWKLEKLKHILSERNIKNNPLKTNEILSLTAKQGVIPLSKKEHIGGNKPKDDLTQYKLAFPNDIVLNSMNIISGAVGLSKYYGCVSPVYYMFYSDNSDINIEYYNYIFQIKSFQKMLLKFGKGILIRKSDNGKLNTIRMKIPIESFKELELPVLDIETQNAIVKFLNNKVLMIEKQIAKFEELIILLEEKRISLINQVVTKGVNLNAPMKDSGIEWIGEIPKHWHVLKLKQVCSTFGRIGFRGYNASDLVSEGEGAYTIGAKHIQNNKLDLSNPDYLSWEKYYESPEIMVQMGDLLITQRGAKLGKIAFIEEDISPATINPSLIILKNLQCEGKFLYYFLCSHYILKTIELINSHTAVPMISQEQVNNFIILEPPIDEQKQIIEYLDMKISEIDKIIAKINENIILLEEYKTSLIHHVVTGKINVTSEI